jgi:excinuclease UvrABC nuclease subunit
MSVNDIISAQNDLIAHTHQIAMWPAKWRGYSNTHTWETHQLNPTSANNIPEESGIYTILIMPNIAAHPLCSYLMYVGKANSLRNRFRNYLTSERLESGRPKIYRLLNMYSENLYFCFTLVSEVDLDTIENNLIDAYVPCCNDRLPASLSPIRRGAF